MKNSKIVYNHGWNNMKRSILVNEWQQKNNIRDGCVSFTDEDAEGHFSWSGCDCCSPGLGNHVYDVVAADKDTHKPFDAGQICINCMAYIANGTDSDVEEEE